MKTILIFSNPFGYGPSGKALSVASYILDHTSQTNVILCGSNFFSQIADKRFKLLKVDERVQNDIVNLIKTVPGEKYIFSSQNRFAIKAALEAGIQSAFLDGLSWFWKDIPTDHLIADTILWLNYPDIKDKIPKNYMDKINIVHGITQSQVYSKSIKREGTLMYIGGCKNPLTELPYSYLDLIGKLIESADTHSSFELSIDEDSQKYLSRYPKILKKVKRYHHDEFINKLSQTKMFISNGGQTATIEAMSTQTPTSFFLPINLSQFALIKKLSSQSNNDHCLNWNDYINLPKNINNLSEKDALIILEQKSKELLNNNILFNKLLFDFQKLLESNINITNSSYLANLGKTGTKDIYSLLRKKWEIV